ncbi:uncharacterized protein LOC142318124 [Lycorma delicatula]|uniref:uncharacterized protein LOC142318124 n=1 Tax=Lycorma delicatula TaxID=130591 RepID=UPI003F519B76
MAVWRRSTRRKGSCSSNSSAESGYKPNSPTQASTAPSKANLPLNNHRELFSVETDGTLKSDENNSMKRRKYCRRPLPPSRPRSLRLQGLSPGQRPLRNRTRSTTGPRCLCCCMLPQCNRIRKNTSLCQV